jgi:transposase
MRDVGRAYPSAEKIHIVMDNLSTHKRKSLLDHFGPKRGANLWNRFEVHYTPKHGSWLNQAEIEISMFSRECLGKDRIATRVTLAKRAAAWVQQVNEERRKLKWGFTREKARSKFNYQP